MGVGSLAFAIVVLAVVPDVLFAILAGYLFSILLRYPSRWIARRTGIRYGVDLTLLVLVLAGLLAFGIWLLSSGINDQLQALFEQLPRSFAAARAWASRFPWARALFGPSPISAEPGVSPRSIVAGATSVVSRTFSAVVTVVVVFFIGVYGAAQPGIYARGMLRLVPVESRPRAENVLRTVDHNIARWLVGRMLAMLSVAVLTSVGLAVTGVPLAIPLGLVAGLFTFIEYLGAVLSAVPALLIGLADKPAAAFWVLVVFTVAHVIEGYLLTPVIARGTVRFPPAFTLAAQALMGSLFGVLGLTFATPIAVILVVFVQKFYVEDVLGDR